ncbi:hypothetical protein QWY85_01830 [Neolewinella lacunae]|uniref:Uncharacterized protein n=1 Tax=Neolewinella lacunae TaxID=1517758 RepID=A0A923PI09_9BACT|nr:hypothetical protein [Neolewinella lacunae]MBC6994442.1 hypothetical protein [Neolewinella lacunae]MDN3633378.1 hypothetical protein [Neolewinella lacunae]
MEERQWLLLVAVVVVLLVAVVLKGIRLRVMPHIPIVEWAIALADLFVREGVNALVNLQELRQTKAVVKLR